MSPPARPLRIGWVGFHQEGIPPLIGVLEAGFQVQGVITLADEPRGRRSAGVDYAAVLRGYDVPVYPVRSINNAESIALLRAMSLDLLFVIGWSQILSGEALATARVGVIGSHASLLPHNRGSAPINWALIRGERSTGNSLIWLSEGVDEGRVIDQMEFPITRYDTCASLYHQVARTNREMVLRALPRLCAGETLGRPQEPTEEPLLPRRRPVDGLIDWTVSSGSVYDFVRALTHPYPGAFSHLDGMPWLIWHCALLPGAAGLCGRPGQVVGPVVSPVDAACGQVVACGVGAVLVLEVESPRGETVGGRALSELEWQGRVWTNG